MKGLSVINAVNLSAAPGSAANGDVYYDTTLNALRVFANGAWVSLGAGGGTVRNSRQDFRVSTESNVGVSTSDRTGLSTSTLYLVPFVGNGVALYESSAWAEYTSAQLSLALSGLTSGKNYDVYAYSRSAALAFDLGPAWSDNTSRGTGAGTTEQATQDGVSVNANSMTTLINGHSVAAKAGRLVGTIRTTGTTTTEDSAAKRFVWNAYNRVGRSLFRAESATSWSAGANSWRYANNTSANRVEAVVGLTGVSGLRVSVRGYVGGGGYGTLGIGEDSYSTPVTNSLTIQADSNGSNLNAVSSPEYRTNPSLGWHFWAWLEKPSGGNGTFYSSVNDMKCGIVGVIDA